MTALAKVNAWSIAPTSLGELMQFAKLVADSELVPKDYRNKPGNVVIAIQMGADVGLSPMQAIQSIAVINGRASMWGDTLMAVVQSSPECDDIIETFDRATMTATCVAKRRGRSPKTSTFSQEDAKRAGLWGKQGPWTQYPQRMLQMRARSFALRDAFSDVLRGIQSAEEQHDVIEVKASVVSDTPVYDADHRASDLANPEPRQLTAANDSGESAPAPRPLPTKTAKNYPEKQYAEVPFSSLPMSALTDYLNYYTERLPQLQQANHRQAVSLTMLAAQNEAKRRLDAEAAGADPETGEVTDDGGDEEDDARFSSPVEHEGDRPT